MVLRVFFQARDQTIQELVREGQDAWKLGHPLLEAAKCHSFFTAVSCDDKYSAPPSRESSLYFRSRDGKLRVLRGDHNEWDEESEDASSMDKLEEGVQLGLIYQQSSSDDVLRGYFVMGDGGIGEVSQNLFLDTWVFKRRPG